MKKIVLIAAAALLLNGCGARIVDRAEKVHAVAAQEADIMAGFILKTACHAPNDALLRWCESSSDICLAIWYGCPEVRALVGAVSQALTTRKEFRLLVEPVED